MSEESSPTSSKKTDVLGMNKDDSAAVKTDKEGEMVALDYDQDTSKGEKAVKVICLGDSAVGKSK